MNLFRNAWQPETRRWDRAEILLGAVFVCTGLLTGCGSKVKGPQRVSVRGQVTLDGKPLSNAIIAFVPQGTMKGPRSAGAIKAGKFELDAKDGPVIGHHRVEITSAVEEDEPVNGQPLKPFVVERIPRFYNSNSTLVRETKADGTNEFRFELSSQSETAYPASNQ
jgi:hypothetical protein